MFSFFCINIVEISGYGVFFNGHTLSPLIVSMLSDRSMHRDFYVVKCFSLQNSALYLDLEGSLCI